MPLSHKCDKATVLRADLMEICIAYAHLRTYRHVHCSDIDIRVDISVKSSVMCMCIRMGTEIVQH